MKYNYLVPVLLPSICGEVHEILSDKGYEAWHSKYGDCLVKWLPMSEAIQLHGQ